MSALYTWTGECAVCAVAADESHQLSAISYQSSIRTNGATWTAQWRKISRFTQTLPFRYSCIWVVTDRPGILPPFTSLASAGRRRNRAGLMEFMVQQSIREVTVIHPMLRERYDGTTYLGMEHQMQMQLESGGTASGNHSGHQPL